MRIAIVEDHELFAEALDVALTLEGHDVRRVSPGSASTSALTGTVLRQRPEIALLDLDLGPTTKGVDLVEPLTRDGVAVVVLTATTDPAQLGECLHHGARTIVPKSAPLNAVLARIRHIGQGRPALALEQRERLVACYHRERAREGRSTALLDSLSRREGEVLGALMNGRTVVEIARSSFVSEATVRTQVRAIRTKLEVGSQLGAVGLAMRARWEPPRPRREQADHRFG